LFWDFLVVVLASPLPTQAVPGALGVAKGRKT
jgi:hypothetical protein